MVGDFAWWNQVLKVLTGKRHWNIIKLQRLCRTLIAGTPTWGVLWGGEAVRVRSVVSFRSFVVGCFVSVNWGCLEGWIRVKIARCFGRLVKSTRLVFCQMLMFLWRVAMKLYELWSCLHPLAEVLEIPACSDKSCWSNNRVAVPFFKTQSTRCYPHR